MLKIRLWKWLISSKIIHEIIDIIIESYDINFLFFEINLLEIKSSVNKIIFIMNITSKQKI